MDHFSKLKNQVQRLILLGMVLCMVAIAAIVIYAKEIGVDQTILILITVALGSLLAFILSILISERVLEPIQALWQGVLHVTSSNVEQAPNLDKIRYGRELATSLLLQVYELGSKGKGMSIKKAGQATDAEAVIASMPLPVLSCGKERQLKLVNAAAYEYLGAKPDSLTELQIYDALNLEFDSDRTLETWMTDCQDNKVTDTAYWERVKVAVPGGEEKQYKRCDIAAHYNRDSSSGSEFVITLFDKTKRYEQDDDQVNFVALAVHELRTPLTMLRGYIEVFSDELQGKLDDEMSDFMSKMELSAKQLTAFVNNILNVSRIDENALVLRLSEADWKQTLESIVSDMSLKARVHGIDIQLEIEKNLPSVAVDKVSAYEVVNNLVDNAIKYSGGSKDIVIKSSLNKEGYVETTVQDFGVGVPESVVPHLFEKFYRNHRTKTQVGGTGLGLYLTKSLITAHGGQVWVSSKVGKGSTFGFSLIPYEQLDDDDKLSGNKEITRTAHGWIKNHSMYRR